MKYEIANRVSGVILGTYEAATEALALDAMAVAAGYRDYAHCNAETGAAEGELVVTEAATWYGVSSGNGNDGVSQMYPNCYVRTNDPWRLTRLALIGSIAPAHQAWAKESMLVDGEAEFTITATLFDPPGEEYNEESGSYSDANGAWHIIEVFPAESDMSLAVRHDSLEEAFPDDVLAMVPADA